MAVKEYKMKVALIGSETEDTIYIIDSLKNGNSHHIQKYYTQGGGINNLDRFMIRNYKLYPTLYSCGCSDVIVVVDKQSSERTIFIDKDYSREDKLEYWNKIQNYAWCHIAYIDNMKNLTVDHMKRLRKHNGMISVDFCLTEYTKSEAERVYKILEYIDVIFISGDNLNAFRRSGIDLSLYKLKNQVGITHHNGCIVYVDEDNSYSYEYNPLPNLNTLGAGDYFAASFICQSLTNFKKSPTQLIENAHTDTLHFLKEQSYD